MGQRPDQIDPDDRYDASSIQQGAFVRENLAADDQTDQDTAEIRAGIDQTRVEMSETIDAIQDRLNPQHIKEQVKEQVREQFHEVKATVRDATIGKAENMVRHAGETVNEARYTIGETIRQNPIPAAMVGIGLGWLFMNRRSAAPYRSARYGYTGDRMYSSGQANYGDTYYSNRYDFGRGDLRSQGYRSESGALHRVQETAGNVANRAQETAENVASRAQETVANVANKAQETVGDFTERAQETAGAFADQAQYQAQRIEDRFQQTLYANPLAVAAVSLALGAAVGLAVPQTRKEDELMGEARDNLIDKAQTVAQDTLEKVQRVAGDVIEEAQTTAQQAAKDQGLVKE
jgi:cell division septum initiation protein DivIVA